MKRNKEEDKSDIVASTAAVTNNNNSKGNNNTSPNSSSSSSSNNNNDANNANGSAAGTVRTTGRVKKPKQVYDPSDNYISRVSRNSLPTPVAAVTSATAAATTPAHSTSPSSTNSSVIQQQQLASPQQQAGNNVETTTPTTPKTSVKDESQTEATAAGTVNAEHLRNFDTCLKCGKSEPKRGSGYKSNYISCKSCPAKWHFACLPQTFEVLSNARKRFKCDKCRRCRICMSKNVDKLNEVVMCCVCVSAYHLDCHWPHVMHSKLNDPKWKCYSCDPDYNLLDDDDNVAADAENDDGENDEMQSQSQPPSQQQSPPRKTKAGRKKRATSDPAIGAPNSKKMAIAKQVINKNDNENIDDDNNDDNNDDNDDNSHNASDDSARASSVPLPVQELETNTSIDEEAQSPKNPPDLIPVMTKDDKENEDVICTTVDLISESIQQEQQEQEEQPEKPKSSPVHGWTVEQVVNYVYKYYPREATTLKTQDIDGAALMVLTRKDVIDRFGLKLGPALRLYELILGLQNAIDDVTLAWCD